VEGTVEIKVKQGCLLAFVLVCGIDNLVVSDFFIFRIHMEMNFSMIWIKSIIPIRKKLRAG
jgi:uncharacterized membrane protein